MIPVNSCVIPNNPTERIFNIFAANQEISYYNRTSLFITVITKAAPLDPMQS
jgi:hypothetical protein